MSEHKPNNSKELAKDILRTFGSLKAKRKPFEPLWRNVARFAGPMWFGWTGEPEHPQTREVEILDTEVRRALTIYARGMLSGACGATSTWFGLEFEDPDFQKWAQNRRSGQAKAWLQKLEQSYYTDLWNSGFYSEKETCYFNKGLFGWDSMYLDESVAGGLRFNSRPLHECYIDRDYNDVVDRHFRAFSMTARDMAEKWGRSNLPDEVRRALDSRTTNGEETSFKVVHAVFPRKDRSESLLRNNMAYASFYLLNEGEGQVIAEGGYEEMPYIVSRAYRLPGTPYCYSSGTEALADVQMANEMKRLLLEAGQLSVAPPYLVPDDGFIGRFSFKPRALNYYRKDSQGSAADFRPLELGGDPRFDLELFKATREDINQPFHTDLFLSVQRRIASGSTPTATEITELAGERMFLLTPLLVNEQVESFTPTFARLFALKMRRGELPPAPSDAQGREFKAVYKSPLMRAQLEYRVNNILSTYSQAAQMVAMTGDTSIWENFDNHAAVRIVAEQRGFPQEALRELEDAMANMKAKAQAQAQSQNMQGIQQSLGDYSGLAKAPEDGSPADLLMRSLRGGVQ
ncbi:MAG: portal protein [Holophaga sp.]|nr:portal protein [Holophaga sp.]